MQYAAVTLQLDLCIWTAVAVLYIPVYKATNFRPESQGFDLYVGHKINFSSVNKLCTL